MPKGPKGQKRPSDVIGNAVLVMKIATGEAADIQSDPAKDHMKRGGLKGRRSRAESFSPTRRAEIANGFESHRLHRTPNARES
jgi:hypothetical protein